MRGENNLIIKGLIDKKIQKKNAGRKYMKGYQKLDLAMVVILVSAQMLTNTPFFSAGYSEMNNLSGKANCMRVPAEYKTGLGRIFAAQNEDVKVMAKNLSETKSKNLIKMKTLPNENGMSTDMATMAEKTEITKVTIPSGVATEEMRETEEVVDIHEEPAAMIGAAAIPEGETCIDENHTTEKDVEEINIGEIQKENSNANEMPLAELTIVGNFAVNQAGIIEKCIDPYAASVDDTIILPTDKRCTGIGIEAFTDIIEVSEVMEVYIPANIIYIEPEAFGGLNSLVYIEVAEENPEYRSVEGVLYDREGNVVVYPAGRREDA